MKPNVQKAKYAILLIWIVLVLEIVSLTSGYMQYDFLKAVESGASVTLEAAESNDNREATISILYLIAFITSAVFFLRWFKTAYHNLHQKTPDVSYPEGWAIGAWFVPILNLFRPYQIMREIYTRTREFLIIRDCEIGRTLTSGYLGWWWALWIINGVLGQVSARASLQAKEIPSLIIVTCVGMAANIVGIPLALVTIKVIKDYARIEPVFQQIDSQSPSVPQVPSVS